MDKVERFRRLVAGWFILAAAGIGLIVGMLTMLVAFPPGDDAIICPPMIDAADAVILHYPPDGGPEATELDWEFAEACGFETIKGPAPVQPPQPPPEEEGGA